MSLTSDKTDRTHVKMSIIPNAGLGLFANTHIMNRERFILYNGVRRNLQELDAEIGMNELGEYWLRIGRSNMFIDATDPSISSNARYANECTESDVKHGICTGNNCVFVQDTCQNVWLQATRRINKGYEIYVSYGSNYHI